MGNLERPKFFFLVLYPFWSLEYIEKGRKEGMEEDKRKRRRGTKTKERKLKLGTVDTPS